VRALEAIEAGDISLAVEILLAAREDGPLVGAGRFECHHCSSSFPWPGARDDHERFAHPDEALAA